MHRLPRIALVVPLLLAAGCKGGGSDRLAQENALPEVPSGGATAPAEAAPKVGYARLSPQDAESSTDNAAGSPPGATPPNSAQVTDTAAPRMIIRTGTATVQVDKLEPAIARVTQLAQQMGGYVANTSVQTGSDDARSASLELKLPAQRWDAAVAGLRPLGKVEEMTTNTEDVGEEFVDVTARMNNSRRLEQRLTELLANRTGKLEDVLAVERELARVREEIERYEGRLRYLRSRVSLSTLTVRLHENTPVIGGRPGGNPITRAFRESWDNFVNFVAALIASLGWLVPLIAILVGIAWLLRRMGWKPKGPRPPAPGQGPYQPGPPPPPAA